MRARFLQVSLWGCLFFSACFHLAGTTNDVIAFGLRHSVITNAELEFSSEESPLAVVRVPVCEYGTTCPPEADAFGAAVHLDAADAGIFISPGAEKINGASLEGTSYATVDGIANSLVGSVKGTRVDYGIYRMDLDFAAIGATSYTYQVYFRDLLAFTGTNLGPSSYVLTGNSDPPPPRVNPLWLKDGRAGVILDFQGSVAEMEIPGYRVHATRLVITAETPAQVELASRVDILGRGGLPQFTVGDEKIGKFGLHHQAFGGVQFGVKPSQLTLSNVLSAPGVSQDGMFTELPRVQRCEATLVPYPMTNDTFSWAFNAVGASASSPYASYFGAVSLAGSNGTVNLLAGFYSTGALVRVFNQGALVSSIYTGESTLGTLLGSNLVMASYFAAAEKTNDPAHIGFRLAHSVLFSNGPEAVVTGDEFRVSPRGDVQNPSHLTLLSFTGENLGEVTLSGMQTDTVPVEPIRLQITRSNGFVRVSWNFKEDYYLYFKSDLNDSQWAYVSGVIFDGDQAYLEWPIDSAPAFFSVRHGYAGFFVTPITPQTGTP